MQPYIKQRHLEDSLEQNEPSYDAEADGAMRQSSLGLVVALILLAIAISFLFLAIRKQQCRQEDEASASDGDTVAWENEEDEFNKESKDLEIGSVVMTDPTGDEPAILPAARGVNIPSAIQPLSDDKPKDADMTSSLPDQHHPSRQVETLTPRQTLQQ